MTLMTTFRSLTVATVLALVALMLYAGKPQALSWWAEASPLALWVIGPVAAPYLLAARRSRRWFAIALLVYFAVSTLFSGLAYLDAFFRPSSSTAALVLVFVPIYQWLALALLLVVCCGTASWLGRRDKAA
jgi:uncharacterized Tic20 family protein